MGSIGPLCVTSNGNTLNAVTTSGTGDNEIVTLAKSNTTLGSLDALDCHRQHVSKTLNTISGGSMDRNVICHIDNQGLFMLLSLHSKSTTTSTAYRPFGNQYNPATNA
ncbi:hypothetical protein BGZ74_001024 [Mortierella antarctica]|nr:hypothetical protein BGZ74_001024 [Mortierella antarctica]